MDNKNTVLTVNNLQISYEGDQIINDLSFEVEKRDILIILGPNGAGKTVSNESQNQEQKKESPINLFMI